MPDTGFYKDRPYPAAVSALIRYLDANPVITSVSRTGPQTLYIERKEKPALQVFLTNIYTVSTSDVFEILSDARVDAIVTMSAWNGYTNDAKEMCKQRKIGLFKFKEFLGAVYYAGRRFVDYTPKKSLERQKY
jgi:hypothetical protein